MQVVHQGVGMNEQMLAVGLAQRFGQRGEDSRQVFIAGLGNTQQIEQREGQRVEFTIEQGPKGLQAANVVKLAE